MAVDGVRWCTGRTLWVFCACLGLGARFLLAQMRLSPARLLRGGA